MSFHLPPSKSKGCFDCPALVGSRNMLSFCSHLAAKRLNEAVRRGPHHRSASHPHLSVESWHQEVERGDGKKVTLGGTSLPLSLPLVSVGPSQEKLSLSQCPTCTCKVSGSRGWGSKEEQNFHPTHLPQSSVNQCSTFAQWEAKYIYIYKNNYVIYIALNPCAIPQQGECTLNSGLNRI